METLSSSDIRGIFGSKCPKSREWFEATGYVSNEDEADQDKLLGWSPAACHAAWALSLFRMRLLLAQEIGCSAEWLLTGEGESGLD